MNDNVSELNMGFPSPALDCRSLQDEDPIERIQRVKAGVPAQQLSELAASMDVPRDKLLAWIGVSGSTAKRRLRANAVLTVAESERMLGIARLVGLVEKIVSESGNHESFNAATWTARWLERPNASLGGRTPGDLIDTADGRMLCESIIRRMQSGAYS